VLFMCHIDVHSLLTVCNLGSESFADFTVVRSPRVLTHPGGTGQSLDVAF
jgi:hypothetical protein